jgi:cell division protein ZapA
VARVALDINGRRYEMACDDGQEGHLQALAEYVDRRVRELASSVGQVGESRLLLMANLLIADELYEARRQQAQGQEGGGDAEAVESLEEVAGRLERIAARLEAS